MPPKLIKLQIQDHNCIYLVYSSLQIFQNKIVIIAGNYKYQPLFDDQDTIREAQFSFDHSEDELLTIPCQGYRRKLITDADPKYLLVSSNQITHEYSKPLYTTDPLD